MIADTRAPMAAGRHPDPNRATAAVKALLRKRVDR